MSQGVLTLKGLQAIADVLSAGVPGLSWQLGLFVNVFQPTRVSDLSNIVEASYPGYSRGIVNSFANIAAANDTRAFRVNTVSDTFQGTSPTPLAGFVQGWFLCLPTVFPDLLYAAQPFHGGPIPTPWVGSTFSIDVLIGAMTYTGPPILP